MCQKSNLLKGKGDRRRDGMKIEENCKKSCGLCGLEGGGGRRRKDSGGGRRRKDSGGERRRKDSGGEAGGGGGCKPGMIRRGGKNVVVKTGSNSRSQCEADCKANSECVAFDYTTNEQSDSCRGVKEVQGDKDPRWGENDDGRVVCIIGSDSLLEIVEDKDKSVGTGKSKGLMRMATNTQADDEDDEDKDKDKSDGTGKSDGFVRRATSTEADDDEDDEIEALIEADGSGDCEDNPKGVTLAAGQMSCEEVAGGKFSSKDGKKAGKRGLCEKSNLAKGNNRNRRRDGMAIEENCKKSCGLCGLGGGGGSGGGGSDSDSGSESKSKSKSKGRKSKSKRRKSESGSSSESESESSLLEIVEDKDKSDGTGKSDGLVRRATNTEADDEDDEDKDKDKSDGTGKSKGLMRSIRKAKANKVIEASVLSDGYGDSRQS